MCSCARTFPGVVCDQLGPRMATSTVLLLIAPCVFCAALIVDRAGIIAVRFFIGKPGLANFATKSPGRSIGDATLCTYACDVPVGNYCLSCQQT